MELDDLKGTWTVLEERLKKNEMLNKQIMEEMLRKKSKKSLNRLINVDFLSLIGILLLIPVCIWLYNNPYIANFFSTKIFSIGMIIFCLFSAIWYSYKLKCVMKIDFSKQVKDNTYSVNKYTVMVKQEKLITYILFPILGLLCVFCYYEQKVSFLLWIFLIIMFVIGIAIMYFVYKRFYDPNIQSVKDGLEEMKNWEE